MKQTLEDIKRWAAEVRPEHKVGDAYAIIRDLVARCERAKLFLNPERDWDSVSCIIFRAEIDALERGE